MPPVYLQVAEDCYSAYALSFEYSNLKGFSNFSLFCNFNFKKFIFTILVLQLKYCNPFCYYWK